MKGRTGSAADNRGRGDRRVQAKRHDTYKARRKPRGTTVCPSCGAVFQKGRWTWTAKPPKARAATCPACRRIKDHYPAGELTVAGPFYAAHRAEVLSLARNEEAGEKAEHPLARIMGVRDEKEGVVIETTDVHLPRRIGEALRRAYQGELTLSYNRDQQFMRAKWVR